MTNAFAPGHTRTLLNSVEIGEVNRIELGFGYVKIRANYIPDDAGQKEIVFNPKGAGSLFFVYPTGANYSFEFNLKNWIVEIDSTFQRAVEINATFHKMERGQCTDS